MRLATLGSAVLAALSGAACFTMTPIALDDLGPIRPTRVWVTRGDQSVTVVEGPQVLNNRLVGFVNGRYQVLPAADVKEVRVRQRAGGRTAALIAAGTIGATALVYALSGTGSYVDPCSKASSECEPM